MSRYDIFHDGFLVVSFTNANMTERLEGNILKAASRCG